jgi:general secretion pathway protein K
MTDGPKRFISSAARSRGIALIAVLWTVMLLALMAQSFTSNVRSETQLTRNLIANGQARALADAAIYSVIDRLLHDSPEEDRLYNGQPERLISNDGEVTISIQDESGKIDINTAHASLLEKLFAWAGLEPDDAKSLADQVADWRDRDDRPRREGAEKDAYDQANRGYEPKNQPLDSIEELRLVLGVSPTLFDKIRPGITVYSKQRGIDPSVAAPVVLAALSDSDGQAPELSDSRRSDRPQDLRGDVAARLQNVQRTNITRSPRTTYTIRATVKTTSGAAFTREAVIRIIKRPGRTLTTLVWRRARS